MPIITTRAAGGLGCVYSLGSTSSNIFAPVTYFMIGGGGGGGTSSSGTSYAGGGGGAGGLLSGTANLTVNSNYTIIVGTGGANATNSGTRASNGGDTVFLGLSALGGGYGGRGSGTYGEDGGSGGCGGGGGQGTASQQLTGGPVGGIGTQGKDGGKGLSAFPAGGSGGGLGQAGKTGSGSSIVSGGNGLPSYITGFEVYYGGGGGGRSNLAANRNGAGSGDTRGGGGEGDNIGADDGGTGVVFIRSNYLATTTNGLLSSFKTNNSRYSTNIYPMRTFVYGTSSTEVLYPFYSDGTITFTNTLASTINNYSTYFDAVGTGGGLVVSAGNNSFTVPASSDFTIEFWLNNLNASVDNSFQIVLSNRINASGSTGDIEIKTSTNGPDPGYYGMLFALNGSDRITTSYVFKPGTWYHMAVVRRWAGGTYQPAVSGYTFYVNGSACGRYTTASFLNNSLGNASRQFRIGAAPYSNGDDPLVTSFVSDLRMTNRALYLSAFEPPTTKLTATSGTWLLTLQDSTWIDNSTNNWTLTAGSGGTREINKTNPF